MTEGLAGAKPDPSKVQANQPSLPSELRNLGPDIGVVGATHRFTMWIDWATAGDFEAFGPRAYIWQVVRLRTAQGGLAAEGDVRRSRRREATVANLERRGGKIKEGAQATFDEEQVDAATAALVAVDASVQGIGALVRGFVSLATQPYDEQGIQFEQPGTYVIRCSSSRPALDKDDAPKNPFVRAPSVAVLPLRVMDPKTLASQLVAPSGLKALEAELAELRVEAAKSPEDAKRLGSDIVELERAVEQARTANRASVPVHLAARAQTTDEQIAVLHRLQKLQASGTLPETWTDTEARVLRVELELRGETVTAALANLERAKTQLTKQQEAATEAAAALKPDRPTFRPLMSFVPDDDGRWMPLLMMLGEEAESTTALKRWVLVDLSTPGHRDRYPGSSRAAGPQGHAQAIAAAFNAFRGEVPYGWGTIGIRLPDGLAEAIGGPVTVPATMRAKPNRDARSRQRLESLAQAAAVAGLLISGPVGVVIGGVGAVAGASVAAYRLYRRYDGGYLEADLATALDITAIVGAVITPAGAWAGSIRSGSRWVELAEVVETGVRRFGYLQMGSQVFVIPYSLAKELAAIPPNLSPGERRARQAEAFLNATRAGLELAIGGYRVLGEAPLGGRQRPGPVEEPGARRIGGADEPAAPAMPGPVPEDTGDTGSSLPRPVPKVVLQPEPPLAARRPRRGPVEHPATGAPGTKAGGGEHEPTPPRGTTPAEGPGPGRGRRSSDEDGEIIELPEGTVVTPPREHATDRAWMLDLFDTAYASNPGRELQMLRNVATGEYVVVQGNESSVRLGRGNPKWEEILPDELQGQGRWVPEDHTHPAIKRPDGRWVTPEAQRFPSGGGKADDFTAVVKEALKSGQPTSWCPLDSPSSLTRRRCPTPCSST